MAIEQSRIKFRRCKETGEIIGLVSRKPNDQRLKGVTEKCPFGKKVCVLSEDLKGKVEPGILYDVELKEMHNKKGFVVVSATPRLFKATLETTIKPKIVYKITISFGHKVIYFDPKHGKTAFSRTLEGVLEVLNGRQDIENKEQVVEDFKKEAEMLLAQMQADGMITYRQGKLF